MILKRLSAAFAGRSFWMNLKREYDVDNGVYVLLMPEDDQELNEQALRHIGDLLEYRRAAVGVVILSDKAWVLDNAGAYSDKILAVREVSAKIIDNLLSFLELYAFSERLLVVSLTKPYANNLHEMLGIHGVTKEDLVCIAIFIMRSWTSAEAGDGQSLKSNS
ncbi:hypothetical protein FACS1894216_04390 [Synergistales bacterium]|nr:hypothetical protein FACS1894216_04390 [Synergistales bacterium]